MGNKVTQITDQETIDRIKEQSQPSFFDKVKSFGTSVKQLATGEGRTEFEGLPEIGSADSLSTGQKLKIAGGNILTPDLNARMQIFKEAVPNAEFVSDQYNNPIVKLPNGKIFYMNKPGFSFQDLTDVISEGVKYATAGKFATNFYDPKSQVIKGTLAQGTGAGLTSVAGDVAAKGLGAEDNVDLTRAGLVTGLTSAFVPAGAVFKAIMPKKKFVNVDGTFTNAGKKELRKNGINPDEISPAQAKLFQAYMSQGATAKQSSMAIEDGAFGIPYYKAQLDGDKELLGILESARRGAFGKDVQKLIMDGDAKQQYAMVSALEEIQQSLRVTKKDSMSGKSYGAIMDDDEVGQVLINSLKALDDEFTEKITTAYNVVDKDAFFQGDSLVKLKTNINKNIKKNSVLDADLTPQYNIASKKINEFIMNFSKNKKEGILDFATIKKFDTERMKINDLLGKAEKGSLDFKNLTIMKKEFDKFLDSAYDQMLFSGDEMALDSLLEARKLVTAHKSQLRANDKFIKGMVVKDDAGRIINKIIAEEIEPQQALNYIFGSSKLGMKDSSIKIIKKLVGKDGIYKAGSPEFDAIRQGAFNRIIGKSTGRDGFSVNKFLTNIDDAVSGKGRDIMKEIYSPEEIAQFKSFANAIEKTLTPKELLNPSGTASALSRLFQGTFEALAKIVGFNFAGMQGLIAAKIISARGRKVMTQKKMSQIMEGVGDRPAGFSSPTPKGLLTGVGIPAYEKQKIEQRGLLQ